ncbi:MAG: putative porin, partial [Flavobacteriales bacterium]
ADSTFFSLLDSANANVKTTFPVQMPSAVITSPNNSELEMLDMSYSHSYNLSKTRNDSLAYFQLAQTFQYKRTKRAFNVLTNTDFFSDFNYDSVTTADSMKLEQLTHQLGVEYHKTNLQLSAGIGQNYYEYLSYSPFEVHWENYLYANLRAHKDNFSFRSDAVFITSENKYESFNVSNTARYVDTGNQIFDVMEANFNFGTNLPELYFDDYVSNHFQWSRTNNRNTIIKADFVGVNTKAKAKVTVNFESQSDAIFWDSDSQIGQTGISVFGVTLEKQFQFGKRFFFSTSLRLQDVVAKQTIEVPNVVSFSKFFFKGKIFRKQLSFDAGINLLYYSSFYSKAYNPALDKFYVQDQQKVGNYPILDVFAEFYLKNSFAFFITLTHANSGLLLDEIGKNYLATTNYPRQDRAFKFGLKWRLFD